MPFLLFFCYETTGFNKLDNFFYTNNILKEEGILGRMLSDIDGADWTDKIEIIGWLYQ